METKGKDLTKNVLNLNQKIPLFSALVTKIIN